jgi:Transcription factor WhiB
MTTAAARTRAARASDRLTVALLTIASQGLRTNCSEPETHHYWLSDAPTERALAVRACRGCPVLQPCLDSARLNDERHGVWGGRDFSRKPGRPKAA